MVLSFTPAQQFRTSMKKIFRPDELHVTRIKNYSVLILMVDGILRFRENGVDIELHPGEYYIQRMGLFQEGIRLGESPIYYYVEFDGSFSDNAFGLPLRGVYSKAALLPYADKLSQMYVTRKGDMFRLNSLMLRIFSELYSQNLQPSEGEKLAYQIKIFLNDNYSQIKSLNDIGEHFGYTVDYIICVFKECYKITPHQYIIERRLDYSLWLLENSDLSIEQIAYSCGYTNISNFYRAFKNYYKQTPKEFKRKREKYE